MPFNDDSIKFKALVHDFNESTNNFKLRIHILSMCTATPEFVVWFALIVS
jgi:hypothetical protein